MFRFLLSLSISFTFLLSAAIAQSQKHLEFKSLLQRSIEMRDNTLVVEDIVGKLSANGYTLTGDDLEAMYKDAAKKISLNEDIRVFVETNSELLKKNVRKKKLEVSKEQLTQSMYALAAQLLNQDTSLFGYLKLNKIGKIRRLLNEANDYLEREKNTFKEAIRDHFSWKTRRRIRKAMIVYERFYLNSEYVAVNAQELDELHTIIQNSYTYQRLVGNSSWDNIKDYARLLIVQIANSSRVVADAVNFIGARTVYLGSKFFGNTVGMLQSRRGLLYKSQKFLEHVKNMGLQVLDILHEKTPFRATDRFIPGYWGHAAIYVGTEQHLKIYKVWDHPAVVPHHDKIRAGATIIEALRPGVQINSFAHFSDIDDFAVLRMNENLSYLEVQDHLIRAFKQIGKKYDFAFDVESRQEIVCSELQYLTYTNIDFNTSKIIGRQTITVDQVAEQGMSGRALRVVDLWINGTQIDPSQQQSYYDQLMLVEGEVRLSLSEYNRYTEMYPELYADNANGGNPNLEVEGIEFKKVKRTKVVIAESESEVQAELNLILANANL